VTLSASQIPESNVIRIEVESADPEAARSSANKAADLLIGAVNGTGKTSSPEVAAEFEKAAKDDAAAQTDLAAAQHDLETELAKDKPSKSKVKGLRSDVTDAAAKAANTSLTANALRQRYTNLVVSASTAANLQLIRTADGLESNRTSLLARLGLAGLVAGAAVGLILAVILERRRVRASTRRGARG
jgi:hypothetical protein